MRPYCDRTLELLTPDRLNKKQTIKLGDLLARPSKEHLENLRWIKENAKQKRREQAEENRLRREWEKENPELADALDDLEPKRKGFIWVEDAWEGDDNRYDAPFNTNRKQEV